MISQRAVSIRLAVVPATALVLLLAACSSEAAPPSSSPTRPSMTVAPSATPPPATPVRSAIPPASPSPASALSPSGALPPLWAVSVCQASDYWQRPGGILTTLDDVTRSIQSGDLTRADAIGHSFLVKVDQGLYTLMRTGDWEPGATVKGLFRDGFRTLRAAVEVYRAAETLDEASRVIPQLTEGTATVDQAMALLPVLQGEYPAFDCP